MKHSRGKLIALGAAGLACAALVAVGIAGRERILEEWYAHVIARGSDEEEKIHAAEELAEMGSGRAVEWLFEEARKEYDAGMERRRDPSGWLILSGNPRQYFGPRGERLLKVLAKTGTPAMPTLIRAYAHHDMKRLATWETAVEALDAMEPEVWRGHAEGSLTLRLRLLMDNASQPDSVRKAAAETLQELDMKKPALQSQSNAASNPGSRS